MSANLAAVAIGTETDGSIVCPSTANGIVGIKPTVGLVSRAGVIPISHTQDTAGPMARTVRDAVIVLGVLAGTDPNDPATADSDTRGLVDYTPFLDADGLRGMRIGVARRFLGFHGAVDQVVESAIAAMQSAGALIVDPAKDRPVSVIDRAFERLCADETSAFIRERAVVASAHEPGMLSLQYTLAVPEVVQGLEQVRQILAAAEAPEATLVASD